jgi:1-acyl-sn-glycerol-3-phosphate acyltransferase
MSLLDPVVAGCSVWRPVVFMSRSEPFKLPILSWLLPRIYVIPIERGASDLSGIKTAIRVLNNQMAFGIFPSGTRGREGKVEPFKTGVAAIALRTGATVVPTALVGTYEALPYGGKFRFYRPIEVTFGKPIELKAEKAGKETLEQLTAQIEEAVKAMLPTRYLRISRDSV